ncbi:MAG: hypothetical protein OIN86_10590 [Candidatus Methanoperedens sp.]|nr:hypothetical protein [Candidatus Methanoperedens sp.]
MLGVEEKPSFTRLPNERVLSECLALFTRRTAIGIDGVRERSSHLAEHSKEKGQILFKKHMCNRIREHIDVLDAASGIFGVDAEDLSDKQSKIERSPSLS